MPPVFTRNFQCTLLCAPGLTLVSPLRDFHPLWCSVPGDFALRRSGVPGPHISTRSPPRIRFALFRFRSPLLTELRLLSFPLPTKMLQFGRLPFANANDPEGSGGPIRRSPVQRLLAPTRSNIAAWHDLHRLPSRAIPHLACSNTAGESSFFDSSSILIPSCVCTSIQVYRTPHWPPRRCRVSPSGYEGT